MEIRRRSGKPARDDIRDGRRLLGLMVSGEFPEVWIHPNELHDQRELLPGRISLVPDRTRLKVV